MTRLLVLSLALAACVPAPKKDYTPADVAAVDDIHELMRIHAKNADPLFAISDQESFTEAELAQMKEAGALIQATSAKLENDIAKDFPEGFADLARQLGEHASALSAAASANDAAGARAALTGMKDTCRGCHGSFR